MGSYISCVGGHHAGCAMVVAGDISTPERWNLPAEAIDIMIEHPFHAVIDGNEYLKTGSKRPMMCAEPLKAKGVYFLVPTDREDSVQEDFDLVPKIKGLKKLMRRNGRTHVLPAKESTGPNEPQIEFFAL